jgi:hypothetical protein
MTPLFMPVFILPVIDEIGEIAVFPDPVGLKRFDLVGRKHLIHLNISILYLMRITSLP